MNEQEFAGEIRRSLDTGLDQMDRAVAARLHAARRSALNRTAPAGGGANVLALARRHASLLVLGTGMAILAALWFGLLAPVAPPAVDTGPLDIMLLTDDIPPQAYADWRLVRSEDVGPQCVAEN